MRAAQGPPAPLDPRRVPDLLFPEADDLFQAAIQIRVDGLDPWRVADDCQWHLSALLRLDRVRACQMSDPPQGRQARHEEVLAAAKDVERLDPAHAAPRRVLRNRERRVFVLQANDRIALVAG